MSTAISSQMDFKESSLTTELLKLMDVVAFVLIVVWLSHAWYYPSYITSDTVPGIGAFNILANLLLLYAIVRMAFQQSIGSIFADKLFLLVILCGAGSIVNSVSPSNTLGIIRLEFLLFGASMFFRGRFSSEKLVGYFTETLGIILVLSFLAALLTPLGTMTGFDAGRWRGLFGHKNALGEYAALTLIVIVASWLGSRKLPKRYAIYGVVAFTCLIKAESSTAIGVLGFSIIILGTTLLFMKSAFTKGLSLGAFRFLVISTVVASYFVVPFVTESLGRDLTFTGRTGIWELFLFFADQRPWTGWGWATSGGANENMLGYIRETLGLPYIQSPHSGYISIIVELGYPVMYLFVLWILKTFWVSSKLIIYEKDPGEVVRLGLIAGLALHMFFESTSGLLPSLWLLLILSLGEKPRSAINI